MTNTNVFQLSQPGAFADPLTEVLRNGARALLAQAVEVEVAALPSAHADNLTEDGHHRLVRHGHLPEREIMTGIGPVAVRCPRVRDRVGEGSERIRFSSAILPPYARRSKSLEVLIPFRLLANGFRCADLRHHLAILSGRDPETISQGAITYQLRRLRLHGLIERFPNSFRYRVTEFGLRVALFFTRTYNRILRPGLAAALPTLRAIDAPLKRAFDRLNTQLNAWIEQAQLAPKT